MTLGHTNQRPCGGSAVVRLHDLAILFDRLPQIAFHFFGVLRRFELRVD